MSQSETDFTLAPTPKRNPTDAWHFLFVFEIAMGVTVAIIAFFTLPFERARLNSGGAAVVLARDWPPSECERLDNGTVQGRSGGTLLARLLSERRLEAWAENDLRNQAARLGGDQVRPHGAKMVGQAMIVEGTVYRCSASDMPPRSH